MFISISTPLEFEGFKNKSHLRIITLLTQIAEPDGLSSLYLLNTLQFEMIRGIAFPMTAIEYGSLASSAIYTRSDHHAHLIH